MVRFVFCTNEVKKQAFLSKNIAFLQATLNIKLDCYIFNMYKYFFGKIHTISVSNLLFRQFNKTLNFFCFFVKYIAKRFLFEIIYRRYLYCVINSFNDMW